MCVCLIAHCLENGTFWENVILHSISTCPVVQAIIPNWQHESQGEMLYGYKDASQIMNYWTCEPCCFCTVKKKQTHRWRSWTNVRCTGCVDFPFTPYLTLLHCRPLRWRLKICNSGCQRQTFYPWIEDIRKCSTVQFTYLPESHHFKKIKLNYINYIYHFKVNIVALICGLSYRALVSLTVWRPSKWSEKTML